MDFNEQIKQLSKRISTLKNSVVTEEATKTTFIMPFFQILGYDVFNPQNFFQNMQQMQALKREKKQIMRLLQTENHAYLQNANPVTKIQISTQVNYLDILPQLQLNLEYLQMALFIDSIQILKKIISWIQNHLQR